jgi:copper(I)-binding protein
MRKLLLLSLSLVIVGTALGHEFALGSLRIDHPWARATPPVAQTGAAYLTLHNDGDEVDRLLSVEAPVSESVELHAHTMENGVMRMRQVPSVELPAGARVSLEPGGLHLMLIGLEAPLNDGNSFPATLTFERAGSVVVQIKVEKR